jgi:hypothetical protein
MAVIALPVEAAGESSMLIETEMAIRMGGRWSRRSSRPAPTVSQGLTNKAPLVRVDLVIADASVQRPAVDKMRREAAGRRQLATPVTQTGPTVTETAKKNNDSAVVPRRTVLVACRLRVRMPWKRH